MKYRTILFNKVNGELLTDTWFQTPKTIKNLIKKMNSDTIEGVMIDYSVTRPSIILEVKHSEILQ